MITKRFVPVLCALALAVSACGGDGEATTTEADTGGAAVADPTTSVAEVTVATPTAGGTLP